MRGDCKFKICKNVICVKWIDNRAVTLIGSNVGDYVVRKKLLANPEFPVQSL